MITRRKMIAIDDVPRPVPSMARVLLSAKASRRAV